MSALRQPGSGQMFLFRRKRCGNDKHDESAEEENCTEQEFPIQSMIEEEDRFPNPSDDETRTTNSQRVDARTTDDACLGSPNPSADREKRPTASGWTPEPQMMLP